MGPPGRGGAWGRAPQCDRSVLGGGLGGRTPPPFPSRAILQLGTLSPGGAVPALVQVFTDPSAPSPHPPRRCLCSGEQVAHLQGLPRHDRDPRDSSTSLPQQLWEAAVVSHSVVSDSLRPHGL